MNKKKINSNNNSNDNVEKEEEKEIAVFTITFEAIVSTSSSAFVNSYIFRFDSFGFVPSIHAIHSHIVDENIFPKKLKKSTQKTKDEIENEENETNDHFAI